MRQRSILVRDANPLVAVSVLKHSNLSETEVEQIANRVTSLERRDREGEPPFPGDGPGGYSGGSDSGSSGSQDGGKSAASGPGSSSEDFDDLPF